MKNIQVSSYTYPNTTMREKEMNRYNIYRQTYHNNNIPKYTQISISKYQKNESVISRQFKRKFTFSKFAANNTVQYYYLVRGFHIQIENNN